MAQKRQAGYRALGYRVRSRNVDSSAHQEPRPEFVREDSDDRRRPSEAFDAYWIHAERRDRNSYPDHSERGGKWMLFINTSEIDAWWSKIKSATEGGILGGSAKVATMKPNSNATSADTRVVCVYTYDVTDEVDCTRVRQALHNLGITWKIPYKTDADTHAGKYAMRGNGRVSKRYE